METANENDTVALPEARFSVFVIRGTIEQRLAEQLRNAPIVAQGNINLVGRNRQIVAPEEVNELRSLLREVREMFPPQPLPTINARGQDPGPLRDWCVERLKQLQARLTEATIETMKSLEPSAELPDWVDPRLLGHRAIYLGFIAHAVADLADDYADLLSGLGTRELETTNEEVDASDQA